MASSPSFIPIQVVLVGEFISCILLLLSVYRLSAERMAAAGLSAATGAPNTHTHTHTHLHLHQQAAAAAMAASAQNPFLAEQLLQSLGMSH